MTSWYRMPRSPRQDQTKQALLEQLSHQRRLSLARHGQAGMLRSPGWVHVKQGLRGWVPPAAAGVPRQRRVEPEAACIARRSAVWRADSCKCAHVSRCMRGRVFVLFVLPISAAANSQCTRWQNAKP